MHFVAIDFETANAQRDSACAVGLAVVAEGNVIEGYHALIRPPTLEFSPRNVAIHGIRPGDVEDQPDFKGLWSDLSAFVRDKILVAHNAPFDAGVLCACLRMHDIDPGVLRFACTLKMARELLPGLPNHRLPTLAALFGIELKHHDACSDAVACARLAVILSRMSGDGLSPFVYQQTVAPIMEECGEAEDYYCTERACPELSPSQFVLPSRPDGRFDGLCFVFTGQLTYVARGDAEVLVQSFGGRVASSVSKKVHYVVVGNEVLAKFQRTGATTGKLSRALSLQEAGVSIQLLRESDFIRLLEAPDA
jgi:DNA polymerase-3 subunit epsilon